MFGKWRRQRKENSSNGSWCKMQALLLLSLCNFRNLLKVLILLDLTFRICWMVDFHTLCAPWETGIFFRLHRLSNLAPVVPEPPAWRQPPEPAASSQSSVPMNPAPWPAFTHSFLKWHPSRSKDHNHHSRLRPRRLLTQKKKKKSGFWFLIIIIIMTLI